MNLIQITEDKLKAARADKAFYEKENGRVPQRILDEVEYYAGIKGQLAENKKRASERDEE